MRIDTTKITGWKIASKTRPIKAKPLISLLVDRKVASKFLVDTLEGHEPLGDGSIICLGEAGDIWQQTQGKLLQKYVVKSIDADGWMDCEPLPDNAVNCFEVIDLATDAGITPNPTFTIVGQWGATVNGEKYPLQVRPPARGVEMKKRINELVFEGEGGSQTYETYELAALYALEKIEMPNAAQAIMIFLGDEQCYDVVGKELAKDLVGVELQKALPTPDLFKKLKQKFAVYHIRKPYGSGYKAGGTNRTSDLDERITNAWAALIGHDHIAPLPDPNRVVDVAFGIFAKEAGRIAYFENELEDRQLKDKGGDKKVEIVYKSLRTIHNVADAARAVAPAHTGKSVMRRSVAPDVKDATPARPAKSLF